MSVMQLLMYSYIEHTHLVCGKPHTYIFELFSERAGLKIWKQVHSCTFIYITPHWNDDFKKIIEQE